MKTWPLCSRSLLYKFILGVMILQSSLLLAQPTPLTPLETPQNVKYPGVYQSFEAMIEFDTKRFGTKASELNKNPRTLKDIQDIEKVDIDPDFMNSVILNSPTGYLHLASRNQCAFYNAMVADLLRVATGKVEQVFIQYQNKNSQNVSAIVSKQDFLNKVVLKTCPETSGLISQFQIKAMDATIESASFEVPSNREQCQHIYTKWSTDDRTIYWCQIHELLRETETPKIISESDFRLKKIEDNRQAVAKILRGKLSDNQQDFLANFCNHADNSQLFCDSFFTTNFFAKVLEKTKPEYYLKDLCAEALGKSNWSPAVLRECVRKLRADPDACFWGKIETSGLSPRPRCDHLSLALNHSTLIADQQDCPGYSDQLGVTNFARVISHLEKPRPVPYTGFCSTVSAGRVFEFNMKNGNEEIWKPSMCYFDRVEEKERCLPFFFGDYGTSPASTSLVTKEILFRTKGAGKDSKCQVVKKSDWNPNLLEYRYGCFIVVNEENCAISRCDYQIMFNEKEIKDLKVLQGLPLDYFPTDILSEKYSLSYVLERDARRPSQAVRTLSKLKEFFRAQPTGIIHGLGCAEDLLPTFFKKSYFNQCTPLPFIVDGIITEGERNALITRSAADNVQAPRLLNWSTVYSSVRSYQFHHPLKEWTLYAVH